MQGQSYDYHFQDDLHKDKLLMIRANSLCFEMTFQGLSMEVSSKLDKLYELASFIVHHFVCEDSKHDNKLWITYQAFNINLV